MKDNLKGATTAIDTLEEMLLEECLQADMGNSWERYITGSSSVGKHFLNPTFSVVDYFKYDEGESPSLRASHTDLIQDICHFRTYPQKFQVSLKLNNLGSQFHFC